MLVAAVFWKRIRRNLSFIIIIWCKTVLFFLRFDENSKCKLWWLNCLLPLLLLLSYPIRSDIDIRYSINSINVSSYWKCLQFPENVFREIYRLLLLFDVKLFHFFNVLTKNSRCILWWLNCLFPLFRQIKSRLDEIPTRFVV